MIVEYHRPDNLGEALSLLAREEPMTVPLGGGTVLSAPDSAERAVVDLQLLGLNEIKQSSKTLSVGATATLQDLLQQDQVLPALAQSLELETTRTLRQNASVAGALVAADGRSPFAMVSLALDAQLVLEPGGEKASYGSILPLRGESLKGKLIREIEYSNNARAAYHYVARTPADLPIVGVALAAWPGGRTRLVVGGFGKMPTLAMDGREGSGLEEALENALHGASDEWGSEEYRQDAAKALLKRAMADVQEAA